MTDHEWDAWGTLWRRDATAPTTATARLQRAGRSPRVRGVGVVLLHLLLGVMVMVPFRDGGPVGWSMALTMLGALAIGAREAVRVPRWTAPSGHDPLALHLDRALLATYALRDRLKGLTVLLSALAIAGGPGTWVAWAKLDGDSAIPYLPPVGPGIGLAAVAVAYGAWTIALMKRLDDMARALEAERAALSLDGLEEEGEA